MPDPSTGSGHARSGIHGAAHPQAAARGAQWPPEQVRGDGEMVRLYRPDRNGGDRSHEAALQRVIEAYQLLRGAAVFA
jgi:hypothetical protein